MSDPLPPYCQEEKVAWTGPGEAWRTLLTVDSGSPIVGLASAHCIVGGEDGA
jgi:hypothetical protein